MADSIVIIILIPVLIVLVFVVIALFFNIIPRMRKVERDMAHIKRMLFALIKDFKEFRSHA